MGEFNGNGSRLSLHYIADLADGLNIVATGYRSTPSEVRLIVKVPGVLDASSVIFPEPEGLADVIEMLIAYRRYVFPDAREVDTTKTVDESCDAP